MANYYRCKFIAGDGAYQYRYFHRKPDPIIRFTVEKMIALASTPRYRQHEELNYREYQLYRIEGKTWVYWEI